MEVGIRGVGLSSLAAKEVHFGREVVPAPGGRNAHCPVVDGVAVGDPPCPLAPLEAVEVTARRKHLNFALPLNEGMMGNEVGLPTGVIVMQVHQHIGDVVLGALHALQHRDDPRDELVDRALKQAMIVGRVGVVAVGDQRGVAAVDRAGEAMNEFGTFLLGDQVVDGHHRVQSCRLAQTSNGVGRTGRRAQTGRMFTASGLWGCELYQR